MFCREAPPGIDLYHQRCTFSLLTVAEFTEHQRTVFCVFSGEGVGRLRKYLNDAIEDKFDPETTMYDDHEAEAEADGDMDTDQTVAGLMNATGINDADDEDMDEADAGEGSQYGMDGEG